MQILTSLFALAFIGLVMAALLTFGFVLFIWFMIVAIIFSACVMIRQAWYGRQDGFGESSQSLQIIEGEYKDISGEP